MRRLLLPLAALGVLATALPAWSAGWEVAVDQPAPSPEGYAVVRGDVVVRASVSGGVDEARYAAYHLRPSDGAWREEQAVPMDRMGERSFAAEQAPIASADLPNGIYHLEVRVWGDVPSYRPRNPSTYSWRTVEVRVDNPPPAPRGVQAATGIGAYRAAWAASPGEGRSDFLGYRVLARRGDCADDPAAYTVAGETAATSLLAGARPGPYCIRIQALRTSPVSEAAASAPSAPLKIRVPGSSIEGTYAQGAVPPGPPPAAPPLGGGRLIVFDRPYGEDLPYGARTVVEAVDGEGASLGEELGPDPRETPLAIGGGLLLALLAFHIRRFLGHARA